MSLIPIQPELVPSHPHIFDQDFQSLSDDMDSVMNYFLQQNTSSFPGVSNEDFFPAIDIQEKEDQYLLNVEVPGMTKDDIDLDLHGNTLTLRGERKSGFNEVKEGYCHVERSLGSFKRDIPFDDQINSDKVKADLKDGILHIKLLKKKDSKRSHKKIKIKP
mgnify:CR=1 FL=1